jgi:hypothetical protein
LDAVKVVATKAYRERIEIGRNSRHEFLLRLKTTEDVSIPEVPGVVSNFDEVFAKFGTTLQDRAARTRQGS